jgi:NAD(P)H dehydrogenase (quinone)
MTPTQILVVYYSRHGATRALAEACCEGVETVARCEAVLRTVPSVSASHEATEPAVPSEGPPYADVDDLRRCDGLLLGSPTRFGNMSAAMKYFVDGTIQNWLAGDLVSKPAGVFTSTGSLHGGQETTLLTMMMPLFHHGMLLVGLPYSEPELGTTQSGGTPYGATHVAGADGRRPVTDEERRLAKAQGRRVAEIAAAIKAARSS